MRDSCVCVCERHRIKLLRCRVPNCLCATQRSEHLITEWEEVKKGMIEQREFDCDGDELYDGGKLVKYEAPRDCSWDEWGLRFNEGYEKYEIWQHAPVPMRLWSNWVDTIEAPHGWEYCGRHLRQVRFRKPAECPICMDDMEAVHLPLKCGHWVHRKCLVDWSDICPVCRAPVELSPDERKIVDTRRSRERQEAEFAEHSRLVRAQAEHDLTRRLRERDQQWECKVQILESAIREKNAELIRTRADRDRLTSELRNVKADRDALVSRIQNIASLVSIQDVRIQPTEANSSYIA